jgi:hypothetical protein
VDNARKTPNGLDIQELRSSGLCLSRPPDLPKLVQISA